MNGFILLPSDSAVRSQNTGDHLVNPRRVNQSNGQYEFYIFTLRGRASGIRRCIGCEQIALRFYAHFSCGI